MDALDAIEHAENHASAPVRAKRGEVHRPGIPPQGIRHQRTIERFEALLDQRLAHLVIPHGSALIRIEGFAPVLANPTGVLLVSPGDRPTRVAGSGQHEATHVVSLAPDLAAALCRRVGVHLEDPRVFAGPWVRTRSADLLALHRLLRSEDRGEVFEAHLHAWAQRLLYAAAAEWRKRPVPCRGQAECADGGRFDLTQSIAAYLDANWCRNVSLAELAEVFGLTTFHLLRVFRRSTGETPHQYTLQLRLRRSLHLLERQQGRLADLAIDLGFSSHGHFSTAFRAKFGLTPLQYIDPRRNGALAVPCAAP